ncbi:MAG: 6,7-dimethyl-8-ribityllumazine synthase [Opitutales bacterium]|nr:6,7-dimethyl-8-ribityllumazine synthase [Opitutales bacterium]
MSKNKPTHRPEARSDLRFAIVASRYNSKHVDHLISRVRQTLRESKVPANGIDITRVPGANELPYIANMLALTGDYDCIITLGVVIAGETPHHEIIANGTATALQAIGINTQVPVINGIIVTNNEAQADERVFGETDRGAEFALAALDIAASGLRLARYLEELDRDDIERERNEEIFGSNFLHDEDDEDDDAPGGFSFGGNNPFHKN